MKSIREKITMGLIATVLVSLLAVVVSATVFNYRSTITTIETMMTETAVLAAERVEQELTAYKNVAMDAGRITQLSDPSVSTEIKRIIIDNLVSLHGFTRGNILGNNGVSIFDGTDYSDREYVQQAMRGNVCVSEPLVSKVTGALSIIVAAPIYSSSRVVGVVYFVPPETFLNDIVSSIHIGRNCRSYMINKNGDTIADITLDTITTQNVEQEYQRGNSTLKSRAAIHGAMRNGESGFGSIKASDGARFLAYAPVNGTDGWSLAVAVPKASYLSDTYFGIAVNVAVMAAAILVAIFVAVKLSSSISGPMRACVDRMKLLVDGDLDSPVPQAAGQDETAELTRSTAEMVSRLNIIINDVGYLLNAMANKNFDIQSSYRDSYVGGYQNILLAMRNLKISLSNTIRRIDSSSGQVASASGQVSTGAQSLSQGAVEQASAVEELGATINDISTSAQQTSEASEEAGQYVNEVGAQLGVSVGYVRELNEAMGKISNSSQEISKIIATIENIAFQTNILALNAAVEAARAGAAGKGFAVVADEVRNLATKSDQAAKATKDLISDSIAAVSEGGQAVEKVTTALEHTHSIAGLVTEKMDTVVAAVESQTNSLLQVSEGISQISAVVQTNSATAQESAAASEELNAEAASLKQLVNQFTLASDV